MSMQKLYPYLTFNGNCREAMTFYHSCLGGELHFQTLGESPLTELLPPTIKKYIVQASLKVGDLLLMGTDMVDEGRLFRGNAMAIFVECTSEEELNKYYHKLMEAGRATQQVERNYWGDWFGSLTDQYGNNWLFHCPGN